MRFAAVAALAASVAGAAAQEKYLGFNSGATTDAGKVKLQADFEQEFSTAQKLKTAPGTFNSVRLYTNIQGGTDNEPIQAFPAAVKTKTKILLGMWASGTTNIDKELGALSAAIEKYGKDFTDLVIGISVGSEDLYRVSADGVKNKVGLGQEGKTIIEFIKDTRDKLKGTPLEKTPVGHVDTWTAWANGTNKAVIEAVDFVGVNSFPYYENGENIKMTNEIKNAGAIFEASLNATAAAIGDKPMWITETGWPVTGPKWNDAQPSKDNAQKYWQDVGCSLFGKTSTFWYILRDSNPDNKMKFGIDPELDGTPAFDLTCPTKSATPTPSASASPSASKTGSFSAPASPAASNGSSTNPQSPASSSSGSPTAPQQQQGNSASGGAKMNMLALGVSMVLGAAAWMI